MSTTDELDVVYDIRSETHIIRAYKGGHWDLEYPLKKRESVITHLKHLENDDMKIQLFKSGNVTAVYGFDIMPNQPTLIEDADTKRNILNAWIPPQVQPNAAPYPTLSRAIDWLTAQDPAGREWLLDWIAAKIQNPTFVPKIAVVFVTSPGAGKGTLAFAIRRILGWDNTATIGRGALEARFNLRWAGKLFVLADEVMNGDAKKDISEYLKMLITDSEVECEGKGINQKAIKNRTAWMFASNDISPVLIEAGDRRYTVYTNHDPITPEHKEALDNSFQEDRETPTDAFKAEIEGFFADMLARKVDMLRIKRPYENEARSKLIEVSRPAVEAFMALAGTQEMEDLLEEVDQAINLSGTYIKRDDWDFGERGVRCSKVYEAYRIYCKREGFYSIMASNKFGASVLRRWSKTQPVATGAKKQVNAYVFPRLLKAEKAERHLAPVPDLTNATSSDKDVGGGVK